MTTLTNLPDRRLRPGRTAWCDDGRSDSHNAGWLEALTGLLTSMLRRI